MAKLLLAWIAPSPGEPSHPYLARPALICLMLPFVLRRVPHTPAEAVKWRQRSADLNYGRRSLEDQSPWRKYQTDINPIPHN